MQNQAQDIIEQTITYWHARTGREFSPEDARQMVSNVVGFFEVLMEWEHHAKKENLERSEVSPKS